MSKAEIPDIDFSELEITGAQLAGILKLTERRIRDYAKEGIVTKTGRGRYHFLKSLNGYLTYVQIREIEANAPPDYQAERTRLVRAQAEGAELKNAQMRRDLLPSEDVLLVWDMQHANIRRTALSIPAKLANRVATEANPHQCQKLINDAICDALDDLSRPSADDYVIEEVEPDAPTAGNPDPESVGGQAQKVKPEK